VATLIIGGALTLGRVAGEAVASGRGTAPHTVAPMGAYLPSSLQSRVEIVEVDRHATHAGGDHG
jgi:hypothetical protein